MEAIPVIAIFDVGKTNKKLFLFDEHYQIVYEKSARFIETIDEDGDTCENLESLRLSVFDSLNEIFRLKKFVVKAVNFSAYGASFVYIGADGKPLTPLYNYLKPYPEELSARFYDTYGGEETVSVKTASPVLGSLNSGMQLYRLKYMQPEVFGKVSAALHLPQYLSYLLTGEAYSDLTSIGCHTGLWNFETNDYHQWVAQEGITEKLPPVAAANTVKPALFPGSTFEVGIGLHDSSAALIPYMVNFNEPFILISTGTWCISLNPFNQSPLTAQQLTDDCLCYLGFQGKPVKASRLFAGYEHETQVKRITDHFGENVQRYRTMDFDAEVINRLQKRPSIYPTEFKKTSVFAERALNDFADDTEAYHQLILDLVQLQV
ncbi:MAG: carbohydrate kinase, partial [Sphingobacteriales bacterium]